MSNPRPRDGRPLAIDRPKPNLTKRQMVEMHEAAMRERPERSLAVSAGMLRYWQRRKERP